MGGGFRKKRFLGRRPTISREHDAVISPPAPEPSYGIDPEMLQAKPISGGLKDADRVRTVKEFFARLPENFVIYQELTKEVEYEVLQYTFGVQELRYNIFSYAVPENRTFYVDNVVFFATPEFGSGLVPAGIIEPYVQCYFEIGNVVPVGIETERVITGAVTEKRAYFPFLNDRVGAREVTFSLVAKSGRELKAYYINRGGLPPISLKTVGVRVEGWLADSNIIEEILEQQR